MSNKHTPWSRSRHRAGLSADQFGSLDGRVMRATTNRPFGDRPAIAGPSESVRLLGSAVQEPGGGDRQIEEAAAAGDDDLPACSPTHAQSGAGENASDASSESQPVSRAEYAPEVHEPGGEPASYRAEAMSHGCGPAESTVPDFVPPRAVPDPSPAAAYPAHPPFPSSEAESRGRSPELPPEPRDPVDTAWSVPETEALELLPVGGQALLGLCIGLAVLLAVGFFYLGRTSGPNQAAAPTAATAVSTSEPGPDIGAGFAWGKVLTNDGSTLTVESEINHTEVVVHTDEHTKVYVLVATTIEAIAEGAPILVYGRKHADGSIFADTITGVSLRALRPG